MKTILLVFYISFFFSTDIWGQKDQSLLKYSIVIQNGISSQFLFRDGYEEQKLAYVNGLRFQIAIEESQKYSSIIGLQYAGNGNSVNWVCNADWDYCQIHGLPPIEVKSTERKYYLSFFFNSKYTFLKKYYIQGGLSLDFPIQNKYSNKYTDSLGKKSRDKDKDNYGRSILINTASGANLIFGKTISINEKWDCFMEIDFKMYNLFSIRFEDYEDYFFYKDQKPWALGLNVGLSIH